MIFNAEGIHLSAADHSVLEYGGESSFEWNQLSWLRQTVQKLFHAEFNCEFSYWDNTRREGNDFEAAFTSQCLSEYTTYRLGQMALSRDRLAGVQ
ncbi:MAG TPA: hypothetical protein VHC21_02575 [Candidatus Saccharimonadales bacterium]|nr:hypothetical protein [Candidatus Saccharimonadales bacterium]